MILIIVSIGVISVLFLILHLRFAYASGHSNFLNKSDKIFISIGYYFKMLFRRISRIVTEFIKDIPHLSLNALNKILYRSHKKTKKLVDVIKGNRIKKDGGSVSIYLKRIDSGNSKEE